MRFRWVAFAVVLLALAAPASAFAYENGRLPQSALAPISHPSVSVKLEKDAAASWNAMRLCSLTSGGPDIYPAGSRSAYRTYDQQIYFWNLYQSGRGNLAARPGTSNHGIGRAVDLANPSTMRPVIDRRGNYWGKIEAPSESWHVNAVGDFPNPNVGTSQRYPRVRRTAGGSRASGCIRRVVREAERLLGLSENGYFSLSDVRALRLYKSQHGLTVNSVVGRATWISLRREARRTSARAIPASSTGTDVRALQGLLNERFREIGDPSRFPVDGVVGKRTTAAVQRFQRLRGLKPDGAAGPRLWAEVVKPARTAMERADATARKAGVAE